MSILLILFVAFCNAGTLAKRVPREVLLGTCYDFQTPSDLDLNQFASNKWYEILRYDNSFERNTACAAQVFFLDPANNKMDISFSFQKEDGSVGLAVGKLNFTKSESGYSMEVQYPQDTEKSSFAILATDINSYSIIYSCSQITTLPPPEKQERLWILSRTPSMTNETLSVIKDALLINGTDLIRYCDTVSQENCL